MSMFSTFFSGVFAALSLMSFLNNNHSASFAAGVICFAAGGLGIWSYFAENSDAVGY